MLSPHIGLFAKFPAPDTGDGFTTPSGRSAVVRTLLGSGAAGVRFADRGQR